MKVKRIVANINTKDIAAAKRFYHDVLGLDVLMDQGWIATYGSAEDMRVQISFMSQGGSGTPVPDLSIEVDDLDAALERITSAGFPIEYGPPMSLGVSGAFSPATPSASWSTSLRTLSPRLRPTLRGCPRAPAAVRSECRDRRRPREFASPAPNADGRLCPEIPPIP